MNVCKWPNDQNQLGLFLEIVVFKSAGAGWNQEIWPQMLVHLDIKSESTRIIKSTKGSGAPDLSSKLRRELKRFTRSHAQKTWRAAAFLIM